MTKHDTSSSKRLYQTLTSPQWGEKVDPRSCSVIVCNRTGGQGKTLIAQLIALAFEEAGISKILASADSSTTEAISKLGKIHRGSVLELGIGAEFDAVRSDASKVVSHWDQLGAILASGNAIVDIGANLVDTVWNWAHARNAGEVLRSAKAPQIVLVVPVRAQAQAIEDALAVLERSIREDAFLPIAARILVLNEASGGFERYGSSGDFERLSAMKHNAGLKIVRLPQCRSEIWPSLERNYTPLRSIIPMTTQDVAQEFHLDMFAASGARADLLQWISHAIESFRVAGLIPLEQGDGDE